MQGQSPSIRQLIMHSMAEWYMRGEQYDQAKLSRILDVAQDLKVCDGARCPAWQPSLLPGEGMKELFQAEMCPLVPDCRSADGPPSLATGFKS